MKQLIAAAGCLIGLFFIKAQAIAQTPQQIKPAYIFHTNNSLQLLNGATTTSFAIHSVNGFQQRKIFAGIGVGIDGYYHTTVPVFIEGRYDLIGTHRKLQCFADAGFQFPFAAMNKNLEFKTGSYNTGTLFAAGFDYLIPVKKGSMILGISISQKQVIQMAENNVWNPVLNRVENIPIKYDYMFNRIGLKIGWVL